MIHQFVQLDNSIDPNTFSSILESLRSDVEQDHSHISIYNPESADLKLARRLAAEQIAIAGAPVKVYVRTNNADYDAVWDEDPDPTYWNPIDLKAFFKPQPLELSLAKFGAEAVNQLELIFDHYQIYSLLQERMLRVGDVVQVPYNAANLAPKHYRITNATPSGNFRYHWLYLSCAAQTLTADVTVRPSEDLPETGVPEGYYEG